MDGSGGPTSATNARGTCARCNHDKEHPDYHLTGTTHHTITTTSGGVSVPSTPPLPPSSSPPQPTSATERRFIDIIWGGFTTPDRR